MNQQTSSDQLLLDRLTKSVQDNLQNEQFGVSGLAEAAGMSKSQLNRRLKALTGQSASQFVREYRLKRAMEMLRGKVATPTEVAYQVGFGSPSYFSTCFKEYYGYSPNEVGTQENIEIPQPRKSNWKKLSMVSMGSILILSVVYFSFSSRLSNDAAIEESPAQISIAVLPVKIYADSSANVPPYLIAEEITSKLSKIDAFSVKESSFAQNMDMREVGHVLQAEFLLGIRFVPTNEEFEMAANVTDAKDGTVVWSEFYRRPIIDLQDVQNEIAFAVANEFGVNLTSKIENQINQKLTQSDSAYKYYLVGSEFLARLQTEENMSMAAELFEKAVVLDSTFAKAWVGLYSANKVLYGRYYVRTEGQYQKVQLAFEKARSLDPNALKIRLNILDEMEASEQLTHLKSLLRQYPENDTIYKQISGVFRTLGQRDSALYYVKKAIEFNPTEFHHWIMAGVYHWGARRYQRALECYFEALRLKPTLNIPHPAYIYIDMGELDQARAYLTEKADERKRFKKAFSHIEYLNRNFPKALSLMRETDSITNNGHSQYRTQALELGLIYYAMGELDSARLQFDIARFQMNQKLEELPGDPRVLSSLGLVYAGLGIKKEAIETVQKAMHTAGRVDRSGYIEANLLVVYIMVGEYDQALSHLEYLMENRGVYSTYELELDPMFDPLRERAEFIAMVNDPRYAPIP